MTRKTTYLVIMGLFALAMICFTLPLGAADAVPAAAEVPLVVAQPDAVAAAWNSGQLWSAGIALLCGLLAIWQRKSASTARKINESLVLAIEEATQLPQVAEYERRIKSTIRRKAEDFGVQPLLHRLVKDLTEPDDYAPTARPPRSPSENHP